jgi:hypothetical protein
MMSSPNCPVCCSNAASRPYGDKDVRRVDCPACGIFDSIELTELTILDRLAPHHRIVLRHWLRHEPRDKAPLALTDDLIRTALRDHVLPLPYEWEDHLICAIGEAFRKDRSARYVVLDLKICAAEIGAPNEDAVYETILHLIKQDLFSGPINVHHVQVTLTLQGWKRYRELTRGASETTVPANAAAQVVVNANNFYGIAAGSVSGETSISTQSGDTEALDRYNQRLRVFEAVRDILGMMYTTVSDDKKLHELVSKTRDTKFLFGDEIVAYVESVWQHASRLSNAHKSLNGMLQTGAPSENRKPLTEVEREEVEWAWNEARVVADKFKKYLDRTKA